MQTVLESPARWRRVAPVLALLALAPWTAECAWGGFTAADFPAVILFLGPLYGGAAVLIRETARRTGGGWPAIVLLAAAFGLVQAGLVDQSLFNPAFLDDTEFAAEVVKARATWVPGLEFSGQQALTYVGGHVALSICAPIAIVESFLAPGRRLRPWLGRPGWAVILLVYVLGSLLIFSDIHGDKHFVAAPGQLAGTVLVASGLIGAALLPRWRRPRPPADGRPPRPLRAGIVAAVAYATTELLPGWAGVALHAAAIALTGALIVRWARRPGWGQRHVLAGWSGGLLVAAATAYLVPTYAPASPAEALAGDLAISVITLALVTGAALRLRGEKDAPVLTGQDDTDTRRS